MTAPVSPSAPVAWRYRADEYPSEPWIYGDYEPANDDGWYRVEPLYASPDLSMVGLREDVLERLKCAAETNAGHWPIEDGRAGVTIRLEDLRDCLALLAREGG